MHVWLANELTEFARGRGKKLNVIGPRGGAKSTVGTLAFPLWMAIEGREPYVWIVSDTKYQARAHLENIRAELQDNPSLATRYPGAAGRGPTWRSNLLVLPNGVAIEAFGTGQRVRGRRFGSHRPSLILLDDLQNDSHVESARARARSRAWFHGMLLKAGDARTNFVNLATALHRDALALELHRSPAWKSRIFAAIERWPRDMLLWEEWEALFTDTRDPNASALAGEFYAVRRAEMDAGAELLWPEQEDLLTLMKMRVESGHAAFEREKQGSPLDPESCEWPESYFQDHIWFDTWPDHLIVKTMALDPSKGRDAKRSDYSAIVMLGFDAQGIVFVEADLDRRPTPRIVADGVRRFFEFRPDAFGIESNLYQELLGADFEDEFRRQGLVVVPWMIDNRVPKLVRVRRLGPFLSGHRLRFKSNSPSTRLLVRQLQDFPQGDHDDGPDALEMALRLANDFQAGRHVSDGLTSGVVLD